MTNVDALPPTQYLILEVLAARHRCGEHVWTFPTSCQQAANALADTGLVDILNGITPRSFRARLTDAGLSAALMDGYVNPIDRASLLVAQLVRRLHPTPDGVIPLWPAELGEEPSWYSGAAILADPVLAAQYGSSAQP